MMDVPPGVVVSFLSAACVFLLKTGLGYLFCALLVRLATSARVRFAVWLGYLVATVGYFLRELAAWGTGTLAMPAAPWGHAAGLGPAVAWAPSWAPSWTPSWTLSRAVALTIGRGLLPLLAGYAGVLLVAALLGVLKRTRLSRAISYRSAAPASVGAIFERIRAEMGLRRCTVWLLPGLTAPAALGWWRPAIYLPLDSPRMGDEDEAELGNILRHELSHIRRRDALWEGVARLSRWLVFFHPLVHWAFSSLRLEREMACDMVVVHTGPDRRDRYAETLVRFGWKTAAAERADSVGIGFISPAGALSVRVAGILEGERVYSKRAVAARALSGAAAVGVFALAMPALWIGFTLAVTAVVQKTMAGTVSQARLSTVRRPAMKPGGGQAATISVAVPPDGLHCGELLRLDPRPRGFHVQNEEEPMSNPVADGDSSTSEAAMGDTAAGKRSGLPASAKRVLIDVATQVGRAALSGGRDHDRN